MFTSRDVARIAGVSQSTVSYVMTGKRPISAETRKRVQAAIDQLTYQPNAGARALASRRTRVIGLVVPFGEASDSSGLLPFLETITGCARDVDHDVLLVTANEGASALTRLGGRSLCDAIVLMDIEAHDARIPVVSSLRVPVILIGVPADADGLYCVDLDFTGSARLAVGELVAAGHDRIAVIGHAPDVVARDLNYVRRFQRGVDEAVAAAGISCHLVQPVEPSRAGARAAVDEALGAAGPGCGLVVPNSGAVQDVLRALAARGVRPGRDVSVVGVCTDAAAEAMEPAVTNVSLEPRDVSRRAMRTLFALLDPDSGGPPPSGVELVGSRLTRRETTVPGRTP